MAATLPFSMVRAIGGAWLLCSPLLWLGAVLTKMDTPERYNTQLVVASAVCVAAVASALGAFLGRPWARPALMLLSWAATVFWASSAYSLYKAQIDTPDLAGIYIPPVVFAFVFCGMAVALHFSEKRPSDAAA